MKTENQRLKEIFAENLGQRKDTPDFELMWQKAAERNGKKRLLIWQIAASIALIVSLVTFFTVTRHNRKKDSGPEISSWSEPTGMLIPSQTGMQITALTQWTSPTRFLLPENHQQIK